ncbi:RNA polymerase sigma factor [Sphingomonas sp.]|uniref:RNA polymerase sigma factor n=1 Tax=Sphingomonas sp. TaxID=28214 RepID=UPI0025F4A86F|nr:RNA polymerase sigma factor [Sphingomonas sp.]
MDRSRVAVSAEGDPIDIEAEFIRNRPQLEYQIARVVRCSETAADLASDLYLKLRRVNPLCYTHGEAWAYLTKMARSTAIDHIRTGGRRRLLLDEASDCLEPEPEINAEAMMVARSEMRLVEGALAELPEKAREMLYLSRVVGLTHSEIAERLGVSKSLTEKYIARALIHCRLRMAEHARNEELCGHGLGAAAPRAPGKPAVLG